MKTPENTFNQQLDTFLSWAKDNTPEDWAQIDKQLPAFCNDETFLTWARKNTTNSEPGLRDLAATIFEASDTTLTAEDIRNLTELMTTDDSYPGFRAACALAKRSNNESIKPLTDKIKEKLKKFSTDDDVSEIAKSYLESIEG
jgi:hypothetical protein